MTETVETNDRSGPDTQTADGTVALRSATYTETVPAPIQTTNAQTTGQNDDTQTDRKPSLFTRLANHRDRRRAEKNAKTAAKNAAKTVRKQQAQTKQTAPAALDRSASHRRAAHIRETGRTASGLHTETQPETTAPIPTWMTWTGVWLDRTLGSLPLIAPLSVSGYYTFHVGTQALHLPNPIALALTLALEGGIWKLSRIYEQTLVAGDSTIGLRAGLGAYIAATGGLIYWYSQVTGEDSAPALVVSAMALAGLYIWSRTARWLRRRELRGRGLVDTQAPKFSALSWLLTPIETPKALRHAVKYRITGPMEALADYREWRAEGKPKHWTPISWQTETDRADTETQTIDDQTDPFEIPADWRRPIHAIETSRVAEAWETHGETVSDAPVSPAPVSATVRSTPTAVQSPAIPRQTVSAPRPRQTASTVQRSETGQLIKHADHITKVQTARKDWRTDLFLPRGHKNALTVSAIKEITGLSGQQTACDVRALLIQLATETN